MSTLTMFPVQDPADPYCVHIIRGSGKAISALKILLDDRYQDGLRTGRAEAKEPPHIVTPEERGETPLPLAG